MNEQSLFISVTFKEKSTKENNIQINCMKKVENP